MTAVKANRSFYQLLKQNDNQMLDLIKDNTKILFFISTVLCILFMLLQWKKIVFQNYFMTIWILLLLIIVGMLCNIALI